MSKHRLIILGVSLLLLTSCTTEKQESNLDSDLSEMGLSGKVKTLTQTKYFSDAESGNIQKTGVIVAHIYSFNEDGNILESHSLIPYDSHSNKIVNSYGENGELRESRTIYDDVAVTKRIYEYDDKGNETETKVYDSKDTLIVRGLSKFLENGKRVESSRYRPPNTLKNTSVFNYDDIGNNIEFIHNDSEGKIISRSIFEYDQEGNRIRTTSYSGSDLYEIKNYTYDIENRLIEESYAENGIINVIKYTYDKIDESGNWLYKLQDGQHTDDISPFKITEREIDYY